jgi:hypothetical protein
VQGCGQAPSPAAKNPPGLSTTLPRNAAPSPTNATTPAFRRSRARHPSKNRNQTCQSAPNRPGPDGGSTRPRDGSASTSDKEPQRTLPKPTRPTQTRHDTQARPRNPPVQGDCPAPQQASAGPTNDHNQPHQADPTPQRIRLGTPPTNRNQPHQAAPAPQQASAGPTNDHNAAPPPPTHPEPIEHRSRTPAVPAQAALDSTNRRPAVTHYGRCSSRHRLGTIKMAGLYWPCRAARNEEPP